MSRQSRNENRKTLIFIVVLLLLTMLVWNIGVIQELLSFILAGDVANQSFLSKEHQVSKAIYMLSVVAIALVCPAILIIICTLYIKKYKKNSEAKPSCLRIIYTILLVNILYYILYNLYWITANRVFIPEISLHFWAFY